MLQKDDRSLKQPLRSDRRRILVVEDDEAIRGLLRDYLLMEGFEIRECADGREAFTRTQDEAFALIVLDVMLPGLDGITLCRMIRAHEANRQTPVLMLTARDSESDKVLGLE